MIKKTEFMKKVRVYSFFGTAILLLSVSLVSLVLSGCQNKNAGKSPGSVKTRTFKAGKKPRAIAVDASGNVWVANEGSNNIMKFSQKGVVIGTYNIENELKQVEKEQMAVVNGIGKGNFIGKIKASRIKAFSYPNVIVIGRSSGNVWVADRDGEFNIVKLSLSGAIEGKYNTAKWLNLNKLAGGGFMPLGMAIDASGNVWTANGGSENVSKLNKNGSLIGSYKVGIMPGGIAIDASGNVWVTNYFSGNVYKLSPAGTVAGIYSVSRWGVKGIAIDPSGDVWVTGGRGVVKLNPSGEVIGNYKVSSPSSALDTAGRFAVAIDTSGDVWTANGGGNTVTELNSKGAVLGIYKVGVSPEGIAIDASGDVWTANVGSNNITELIGAAKGPQYFAQPAP